MNNISYLKNKLFINKYELDFLFDIDKIITTQNIILVLLNSPPKSFYNRNIFGVDYFGNIIWQIEEPKYIRNTDSSFTDIWIDDETNQIKCYNWFGSCHIIDVNTGVIDSGKFVK